MDKKQEIIQEIQRLANKVAPKPLTQKDFIRESNIPFGTLSPEHVRIEFEHRSSNFYEHGHNSDDCDLIVCWIHDWDDCPIEVLELKSELKKLLNK